MINGKKLKELRMSKGLKQKELAEIMNISASSICGYEKENKSPDADTLKDLCKNLKTTPNYLLDFDIEITINEEIDDSYNSNTNRESIYISNSDLELLNELKRYDLLYKQISEDPKKWFEKINSRFN